MTAALVTAGAPADRARHGLVLLHGRGATAADILSLLSRAGLPDVAARAPNAPGNSWWPTSFLAPAAQMEPFVQAGLAVVEQAVADLRAGGLPLSRIWVAGFSQGACLAMEYAARSAVTGPIGGAFGFSGGLVGTGDAAGAADPALFGNRHKLFDYPGSLAGAQVYLSVHEDDPHIPASRAAQSASVFRSLHADVEARVFAGSGHAVMHEDLAALRSRLNTAE